MLSLLLLAATAAPQPGELRTFKDWTVGCDNGLSCHAMSLDPDNGFGEGPQADVQRAAGPGSPTILAISLADQPKPGDVLWLGVDGGRMLQGQQSTSGSFEIALTAEFADQLANGGRLRIRKAGKEIGSISLAGLSAVLRYVDDRQGRAGTLDALVARGARPVTAVPAAPAVPRIRAAATGSEVSATPALSRLVETLRREQGCTKEDVGGPDESAQYFQLDAERTLILMSCGAGAYNYSSVPIIATARGQDYIASLASFDVQPGWGEAGALPMLVNAGWDEGFLNSYGKGWGLGDCGSSETFAWDGERFRLIHASQMDECRGVMGFIVTWRAEVVPGP